MNPEVSGGPSPEASGSAAARPVPCAHVLGAFTLCCVLGFLLFHLL